MVENVGGGGMERATVDFDFGKDTDFKMYANCIRVKVIFLTRTLYSRNVGGGGFTICKYPGILSIA
jgi:hypothetical protein